MPGLIAIVGRPNVGKSALFNRLAGRRIAIVHDEPGVTRDRVTAEVEWRGRAFTLVDTGGIGLARGEKAGDIIAGATLDQVRLAIDAADVLIQVVNVQEGIVPLDREVANQLRPSGKPVLLAVNKADTAKIEDEAQEFSELGLEPVFPVSAIHGRGMSALMEMAVSHLPVPSAGANAQDENVDPSVTGTAEKAPAAGQGPLKLAIVGRPNVGKSSLINALIKSDRVIVSPIPGTTRDTVDVPLEVETDGARESYVLIDTAGMRKARRVHDSVEFYSVKRAEEAIERCDLVVQVLDAEQGILEQDKKVSDKIVQARRACVLVVNKWDLVEDKLKTSRSTQRRQQKGKDRAHRTDRMETLADFSGWVQERLFFLDYAPVIFTSAKSGFHLDRLLESIRYVAAQLRQSIPTALLNRALHDAVEQRQPISRRGTRLKFFYATQTNNVPPTFLLFVDRKELFSDQYKKYLADALRRAFGFEGCPLVLVPKPRPKKVESIRTRKRR